MTEHTKQVLKIAYHQRKRRRLEEVVDNSHAVRFCLKCSTDKSITEFNISKVICKNCEHEAKRLYTLTLEGYLARLLNIMKCSSRERKARGKNDAECVLTLQDLMDIYSNQKGKCYYFRDKTMLHAPRVQWRMSPERLNNSYRYDKDNTVLCCYEFKALQSWSLQKVDQILSLRLQSVDLQDLRNAILKPTPTTKRRPLCIKWDKGSNLRLCNDCREWRTLDNWTKSKLKSGPCKICERHRQEKMKDSIRSFIQQRIRLARFDSKKRKMNDCSLTLEKLMNKALEQEGKCYYSGVPLVFHIGMDWQASIERFDNTKDYIDGNWCWIALEFQTTQLFRDEIGTQWTKDKFNEFLVYLEKRKQVISS